MPPKKKSPSQSGTYIASSGSENPDIIQRDSPPTPPSSGRDSTPKELHQSSSSSSEGPKKHKKKKGRILEESPSSEESDTSINIAPKEIEERIGSDEKGNESEEDAISSSKCSCASFFCCCISRSSKKKSEKYFRTHEEEGQYRRNCVREDRFNTMSSAVGIVPVNGTGWLFDNALLPNDSNAVPVFAFLNLLRSIVAIGVNMYFRRGQGEHSRGSSWSVFTNSIISILSLLLLAFSLAEVGVEERHDNQDTLILFFTIAINCLGAGIFFMQTGELGYHSYNQVTKKPQDIPDEEQGLTRPSPKN
ncbi:hypothetical protein [Legionella sp. W05-934-2]|jgi:hypothetical protein|uniref:hypothetical protein n=1 Tax=Legionella sp. W05-934-2 TaxID=1198649 RepID=UPI0034635E74